MLVKCCGDLSYETYTEYELHCETTLEAINLLTSILPKEFTDSLLSQKYHFILHMEDDTFVGLNEMMLAAKFPKNTKELLILPQIEAEYEYIVAGIAYIAGVGMTTATGAAIWSAATIAVYAAAAVVYVGAMYGLSMLMQALSPGQSYSNNTNPARTKASNLYNSRNMVKDQGGSVPVIFGNPYCSGVLIANGLSTEAI